MTKLHNHRHPAGLEWVILKKIPKVLLAGIFIPLFMAILARLFPIAGTLAEIEKHQIGVDILSMSLFFMVASAAFTLTIGCVIVVLMKGPAYVADAYKLDDADKPKPVDKSNKRLSR